MTTNTPPSEATVQAFANMSAALTGFQPSFIRPFLDPVNLSGIFYEFAVAQVTQTMMDDLMNAFAALSAQTPALANPSGLPFISNAATAVGGCAGVA